MNWWYCVVIFFIVFVGLFTLQLLRHLKSNIKMLVHHRHYYHEPVTLPGNVTFHHRDQIQLNWSKRNIFITAQWLLYLDVCKTSGWNTLMWQHFFYFYSCVFAVPPKRKNLYLLLTMMWQMVFANIYTHTFLGLILFMLWFEIDVGMVHFWA